jgi:hypothetical protein
MGSPSQDPNGHKGPGRLTILDRNRGSTEVACAYERAGRCTVQQRTLTNKARAKAIAFLSMLQVWVLVRRREEQFHHLHSKHRLFVI